MVALDAAGQPDFAGLQAALSDGDTGDLIFFAFDLLAQGGEDLRGLPLRERKARLKALMGQDEPRLRFVDHFETAGDAVLLSACKLELEGVISEAAGRALPVGPQRDLGQGQVPGRPRGGDRRLDHDGLGVPLADRRGLSRRQAGPCGPDRHGLRPRQGRQLLPRLKALETKASPFEGQGAPRDAAGVHWVKPELVAEIEYAGFTGDGAIRQAAFKGLREDKPAAEVEAEVPASAETAELAEPTPKAAKAASKPETIVTAKADSVVLGVTISSPDKPLWPDVDGAPATKIDLARYMAAVGEWMLPHVKGRPASIIRVPDGIGGETFFQRHATRGCRR